MPRLFDNLQKVSQRKAYETPQNPVLLRPFALTTSGKKTLLSQHRLFPLNVQLEVNLKLWTLSRTFQTPSAVIVMRM